MAYDGSSLREVKILYKDSDEDVTNSTAFQNDNDLNLTVAQGENWLVEWELIVTEGGGGFKWQITGSTSGWVAFDGVHFENTSGGVDATTQTAFSNGDTWGTGFGDGIVRIKLMVNSVDAGNINLQWAQNGANANATGVERGSWMKAMRIT
jgi:hypothetical protein